MNVREQVLKAYSDCNYYRSASYDLQEKRRQLMFRASEPVSCIQAIDIMREAVPDGYNAFNAQLLNLLPLDSEIILAREYSVCVYVKGELPDKLQRNLECDDFDYDPETDMTRIWWD